MLDSSVRWWAKIGKIFRRGHDRSWRGSRAAHRARRKGSDQPYSRSCLDDMDSQQKAYPTDISFSNASTICQTIVSKQSDFRLNKNKVGEQIKRARNFG
ncbi:hypothetical protein IFVP182_C2150007 [Vibrio parahaemolyticus]